MKQNNTPAWLDKEALNDITVEGLNKKLFKYKCYMGNSTLRNKLKGILQFKPHELEALKQIKFEYLHSLRKRIQKISLCK
jgi:hypothetical protein